MPWAEFSYNMIFQSAASMTPVEAVNGRTPPTLKQFLPGEIKVPAVEEELIMHDHNLGLLKKNLEQAQQRMKALADSHRRDIHF